MLNKRIIIFSLAGLVLLLAVFSSPLLRALGGFLSPQGTGWAEAVIVEGSQVIYDGMVEAALTLVREGQAKQIILVLHSYTPHRRFFAIQENYADRMGEELERRGLKKNQYQVWTIPINGHPITLTAARSVVPRLAEAGIHRAYLLCRSFHTRRSLLIYQSQGNLLGIRFIPYPYFPGYDRDSWWKDTDGIGDFALQTFKLGYYFGKGYIPIISLFRANPAGLQAVTR